MTSLSFALSLLPLLLLLLLLCQLHAQSSCSVSNADKKDCGYAGIDETGCLQKSCCWDPQSQGSSTPWCFYADDSGGGGGGSTTYNSYDLFGYNETANGFEAKLTKTPGTETSTYGADITNLSLTVVYESAQIVRVKMTSADSTRWEVPQSVLPRTDATTSPAVKDYEFRYTESPFTFEVVRVSDGAVIFSSSANLLFKDQYLELTTAVSPDAKIFGLGESARLDHALTRDKTYTGWASDTPALLKNINLYGSYPFYLQLLDGAASGAVLMNRYV